MRNKINYENVDLSSWKRIFFGRIGEKVCRCLWKQSFRWHIEDEFATDTRGFDAPYFQQFEQSEMLSGWSFDAERQFWTLHQNQSGGIQNGFLARALFKVRQNFAPLARFIGLERYQTKSNELEKLVIEAVSGTNYRRAVKDLERARKLPVSFHTAHGWVMRSDCDEINISPQTIGSAPIPIMPDGTGFKVAIDKLIGYFDGCGYSTAATYIRRAKLGMFGYIRRWLKWGLISPRASSMVERVMRELGRRLKKNTYGWSDKGATKIARIISKRFTDARAWEVYWQNKMNCVGNVVVNIGNYKCFSQNLGQ